MADRIMDLIVEAIKTSQSGQQVEAKLLFEKTWEEIEDDPLHICMFSHYMADLQDDKNEELEWNLKSLEAFNKLTNKRLKEFNPKMNKEGSLASSIYLNIAQDYNALGNLEKVEKYLDLAEQNFCFLKKDEYGKMMKDAAEELRVSLNK